jgi:hypothetical protein
MSTSRRMHAFDNAATNNWNKCPLRHGEVRVDGFGLWRVPTIVGKDADGGAVPFPISCYAPDRLSDMRKTWDGWISVLAVCEEFQFANIWEQARDELWKIADNEERLLHAAAMGRLTEYYVDLDDDHCVHDKCDPEMRNGAKNIRAYALQTDGYESGYHSIKSASGMSKSP